MPVQTDFVELRFPIDVAFGSSGGPERSTEIVTLGSGKEHRNQRWADSRRRYDAGYGIKDLDALENVLAFFEARRGPLVAFRFRDPVDWKSCPPLMATSATDQHIATGDGSTATFQLLKSYGNDPDTYRRPIRKPVGGTLDIAVDGGLQQPDVAYTADLTTGEIHFLPGHVPSVGASVAAGFEFDVPVRFASDQFAVNIAYFTAGDVPSIPLVEVLL